MNAFEISLLMSLGVFLYIVYTVLVYEPLDTRDFTSAK